MTVSELVSESGLKVHRYEIQKIGNKILKAAKSKKVPYKKVTETIFVNDYPESFIETMQDVLIDYVNKSSKKEVSNV